EYVPDVTEGIIRVEDLPPPRVEQRSRSYKTRRCPRCAAPAPRCGTAHRTLHDLGDPRQGRPIDLYVTYSKHRCPHCRRIFNADMTDLAAPKAAYTHRAQQTSGRLALQY